MAINHMGIMVLDMVKNNNKITKTSKYCYLISDDNISPNPCDNCQFAEKFQRSGCTNCPILFEYQCEQNILKKSIKLNLNKVAEDWWQATIRKPTIDISFENYIKEFVK